MRRIGHYETVLLRIRGYRDMRCLASIGVSRVARRASDGQMMEALMNRYTDDFASSVANDTREFDVVRSAESDGRRHDGSGANVRPSARAFEREDLWGLGLAGGLLAFIAWGRASVEPYAAAAVISLFAAFFIVVAIVGATRSTKEARAQAVKDQDALSRPHD